MKRLEILLFGVCIVITLGLYSYTNSVGETFAKAQFARLTEDSVESLKARMITYLQSLNGAASLLRSSELVTRDDFSAYVSSLEIEKYLPGINGIGFIAPINTGGETEFYEALRRIGEDRLTVKPQTGGPERFVITRIAPFAPNVEALGLDIAFEQGRREAAQYARESGSPQLTPRILLAQDQTRQPGFLLLMPMYQQRYRPASDTLFRGEFIGWVYAPFIGQNLLRDLVPEQGISHHITVFDGPGGNEDRIIYKSVDGAANHGAFAAEQVVPLFGRTWTVQYKSTDAFEQRFRNFVPNGILAFGLVLTFMLVFTMRNLRKRAEALSVLADLRNRQAKARDQENRAIVENAIVPVFVLSDASEIVFANQAAQACFGFNETEFNGMQFTQLVQEISDPSVAANATGTKKSGHQLFLDVQSNQWVDSEGKQRVTAMVRDLSAEIEAIKELKQNKVLYDLALWGSRIGVFEVDLTAEQSEVSDTWREIMGYGLDEILDDTQQLLFGRIHPEDLHILRDADTACKEGRNTRSVSEFRVAFPGNSWRWMRSDAVVVERDEEGKPLRLIGTQTDVTELRRANNALVQCEQSLQKIISAAPIGMALIAPNGVFISVNDAFSMLCGQKRNYLLDAGRLSEIMSKEDFHDLHDALMLQAGENPNGIYRGEHRILHSSGSVRWGFFNVSWILGHGKQQTQFILQIKDITAQKRLIK